MLGARNSNGSSRDAAMLSSEVQEGSSEEGGGVDVNTQVVLLYRERDESRNRLKRPPW